MPVVMLNSPASPRPVRAEPGRHPMARNGTNRRGRRGDGSISERTRADGTVVYDTYWRTYHRRRRQRRLGRLTPVEYETLTHAATAA
jgi:hypothetical protein